MLALVLALALAASPPSRQPTRDSDEPTATPTFQAYLPKLDGTLPLRNLVRPGGQRAPALQALADLFRFHPVLTPLQPGKLLDAGLSGKTALFIYSSQNATLYYTLLPKPKEFRREVGVRPAGAPRHKGRRSRAAARKVASDLVHLPLPVEEGATRAGYYLKEQLLCAYVGSREPESECRKLFEQNGTSPTLPDARLTELVGSLRFLHQEVPTAVEGQLRELSAEQLLQPLEAPLAFMPEPARSPYGMLRPGGPFFLRAHLTPSEATRLLRQVELDPEGKHLPVETARMLRKLLDELSLHLTGHVVLQVEGEAPEGSPERGFLAARQVLAAEINDKPRMESLLDRTLTGTPGLRVVRGGYALTQQGVTVVVRLWGRHLVLGSDEKLTHTFIGDLPSYPMEPRHPVEFGMNLRQLRPLLERDVLPPFIHRHMELRLPLGSALLEAAAGSEYVSGFLDAGSGKEPVLGTSWTLPD